MTIGEMHNKIGNFLMLPPFHVVSFQELSILSIKDFQLTSLDSRSNKRSNKLSTSQNIYMAYNLLKRHCFISLTKYIGRNITTTILKNIHYETISYGGSTGIDLVSQILILFHIYLVIPRIDWIFDKISISCIFRWRVYELRICN